MNRSSVKEILERKAGKFKTKREAALYFGISDTHLNRLLSGEHEFPQDICNRLGLERKTITTYTKVPK